eukprot:Colp12_sorted_trinity150504_noHs@8354
MKQNSYMSLWHLLWIPIIQGLSSFHLTMSLRKVAVVTGASRGIGKAVAELLAKDGYSIAALSKNANAGQVECQKLEIVAEQQQHIHIPCDVSSSKCIQNAFQEIEKLGPLHVLVNSAGISRDALLLRLTQEDLMEHIQVNLVASILTSKAAVKLMMKHQHGSIVNIGSVVGEHGNTGQAAYSASKAGLAGFTRSLAKEVGRRNIRVNMVAPGYIDTDMTRGLSDTVRESIVTRTALHRIGTPQEVAAAVKFLCDATYVTGQVLKVD